MKRKLTFFFFFVSLEKKGRVCVCMGARRRKLNRELLGIDREAEKDEESFGFKGLSRGVQSSLARFACRSLLVFCFLYMCIGFYRPALCLTAFLFSTDSKKCALNETINKHRFDRL